MALDAKERKELVSTTMERLSLVIGASGNAEELVSLVTQIVKATKKLVEGMPEATKTRGTSKLAEFVFAAKKIAQDARAVDSSSLQQLSSTRKAVEMLVKELDEYYESKQKTNNDMDLSLENLLTQPLQPQRQEPVSSNGSRSTPLGRVNSPSDPPTETERKLVIELKRQQDSLQQKADPQRNPLQHGQPSDILRTAVAGLQRGTSGLIEASTQRSPSKEAILEPTILLANMVSMLMDLVDSLFVSKYPMRAQVHSFCCMLIDNALAYGVQSKSDDAASLRLISTQAPALMSALEVMVEQCYKRSHNIRESQQMSIQRGVDLHDLDINGPGQAKSPSLKKRKEPPLPPTKKEAPPPPPKDFEICCMICTNVAVDSETHQIITKGTAIQLKANRTTSVREVRKDLSARTGLPLDHIQLRFRGDDVLLDETKVTADNALPYFMFNLHEPGEDEIQDFKKAQRRKQRMRIDDVDWTKVPSPVAVAIFDYESLGDGEDDSLEFEAGDLIEITEKSADGWWSGRIDGRVGVIPASFVEEIQIPQSKDEAKKLVKKFKQGKLGAENQSETKTEAISFDDAPRSHTSSPNPPLSTSAPSHMSHSTTHIHNPLPKLGSGVGKVLRRIQSGNSQDYSKLARHEHRRESEPVVKEKKERKRGSLFKKKHVTNDPIMEYREAHSSEQGSPLLSSAANRKHPSVIPESVEEPRSTASQQAQAPQPFTVKRLSRPASSPRMSRNVDNKVIHGESSLKVKRRPPPPPPPFQKTYPRRANDELDSEPEPVSPYNRESVSSPPITMQVIPASPPPTRGDQDDRLDEDEDLPPITSSTSMEELFRNLEEFDELASPSLSNGDLDNDRGERDFATIPRSELPPRKEEVETEPPRVTPSPHYGQPPTPEVPRRDSGSMLNTEQLSPPAPRKPPRRRSKKQEPPSSQAPPPPESVSPASSPLTARKPQPPPKMVQNGLKADIPSREGSESPQPQPPPRRKSRGSKKRASEESPPETRPVLESPEADKLVADFGRGSPKLGKAPAPPQKHFSAPPITQGRASPLLSNRKSSPTVAPKPGKSSPVPPPKPKGLSKPVPGWKANLAALEKPTCSSAPVSRTVSPDDQGKLSAGTRESSASTDVLTRSPVVMRRTYAVNASMDPEFSDEELEDCTGIGKEGVLHKEGAKKVEWKSRYFRLMDSWIDYFETAADAENSTSIGQIPVSRMHGAVPLGEKDGFQCFAINMRYDTSVILGCHSRTDMDDWVKSINKMIKSAKSGEREKTYSMAYKTALKCVDYLSSHVIEDRAMIAATSSNSKVSRWLEAVDRGEEPDLSKMPDAIIAATLLRSLFRKGRLGCLVKHSLAKELCDLTQSANPISVLGSKLEKLSEEIKELLKQLLRLFGKILEFSHKNHTELDELNRTFGPLIFEKMASAQSEPLLAYLISTCELIIS